MDVTLIALTLLSLLVAATTSIVAWRMVREERRRSEARVAALAAEIRGDESFDSALPMRSGSESSGSSSEMFRATQSPAPSRIGSVVAFGMLMLAVSAALVVVFAGAGGSGLVRSRPDRTVSSSRADPDARGHTAQASPALAAPLELVALGHERDADGLTVRGVVRNPAAGREVSQLSAVVLLFNHEGGFIASGRAAVQAPTLRPGGETTFVITVPGAADVGRYRVSFRTDDRVIPHVDLRG